MALKIGLSTSAAVGVIGLLAAAAAGLIAGGSNAVGALAAASAAVAVAGIAAYVASARHLQSRLERVNATLAALLDAADRDVSSEAPDLNDDELDRLARTADRAQHGVQKRMEAMRRADSYRRDYVGDVSHEIKTPIFAIQGFAETLLNGALDDAAVNRSFIQKILNHANRLGALARDLSDISRLEAGVLKLDSAPFQPRDLLYEIRDSLEQSARQKEIEVRVAAAADVGAVRGDRERIRQVLTNLLDNAVKYNKSGGWIEMRAEPSGRGDVRFTVEDSGMGIEAHEIPRLTERFYRAEKSRSRSQGGSGLGLAIAKHILAAHGTTLHIASMPGEGSAFSFGLPEA